MVFRHPRRKWFRVKAGESGFGFLVLLRQHRHRATDFFLWLGITSMFNLVKLISFQCCPAIFSGFKFSVGRVLPFRVGRVLPFRAGRVLPFFFARA